MNLGEYWGFHIVALWAGEVNLQLVVVSIGAGHRCGFKAASISHWLVR